MSEKCSANTKRGTECRAGVVHGTEFCALHGDPTRAANLGRKGGQKNRHYVDTEEVTIVPPKTPEEVKDLIAQAMADVRAKKLEPKIASTLTYMANALLKAFESTDAQQRFERLESLVNELQANAGKS